jgi:DNA-binding winged helix-turn-helix (wHTH) protein
MLHTSPDPHDVLVGCPGRPRRDGTELELTAKEFALLDLFMRHPGELLSRSRILEELWDFAYDGVSNIVDQYVARLRRKIDRPFDRQDIETVRGDGYRLIAHRRLVNQRLGERSPTGRDGHSNRPAPFPRPAPEGERRT